MAVVQLHPRRCRNGDCRSKKTKVIATRDYPHYIYRQRECLRCKHRWRTYEILWSGRGSSLIERLTQAGELIDKLKQIVKGF